MRECVYCETIVNKGETPCLSAEAAMQCPWPTKAHLERLRAQIRQKIESDPDLETEAGIELPYKNPGLQGF